MKINGQIKKISGNELTIQLDDDMNINRLMKISGHKLPKAELNIDDGRTISADQRKKIYAIIRDIGSFTGYMPEEAKQVMKFNYVIDTGNEEFSFADCSVEQASTFIEYLIEWCFKWNVPFKTKPLELAPRVSWYLLQCLRYHKCAVCGQKGDIHHQDNRVGMGNNRNHIDHRKSTFICLCRTHHNEIHKMGALEMMAKYQIRAIKLNKETIVELKLNTQNQINDFDERKEVRNATKEEHIRSLR